MRRKLIGLLGLVMAAGILMGMSKDDAPVLYVSEESVPESGKGIYNEQEQVSFVLRAEKSGDSLYLFHVLRKIIWGIRERKAGLPKLVIQ